MNNRYVGALIISPILIFLFLGGIYLKIFVLAVSLAGMYEFYKVTKLKSINPLSYVGYSLCILYQLTIGMYTDFNFMFFALIFALMLMFCITVFDTKYNFIDIAVTALGFLYIGVFFSFIVLVSNKQFGYYFVWLIFISSWVCDTSAYYSGKFFGKTKLCPKVSPKKTVEGAIGGLLGSALSCGIFGFCISQFGVDVSLMHFVFIGILSGIFSQFGDLTASSVKRFLGVKDYSNLIPGHGGILDRFDSILFSALTVFYYLTFILKI
ncbi:MAG: phosphatidate cytidylyltransferase [Clostridiaceae bacterium]